MSRAWTTKELSLLRERRALGAAALGDLLDRSARSVALAAYRHGISLRRPGEARGILVGQRRGVCLTGARRAIVADPQLAAQRAALYREDVLCPDCGRRRVDVAETGLCEQCHAEFLERSFSTQRPALEVAERLLLAIAEQWGGELDTQRILAQARQRRRRERVRA